MGNFRFFIVLALMGLVAMSLGCTSKTEAARQDTAVQQSYSSTPEGFTGVYLGPEDRTVVDMHSDDETLAPPVKKKRTQKPLQKASQKALLDPKAAEAKDCYAVFRQAYGEAVIGKMQKSADGRSVIKIKGKEILLAGGKVEDIVYATDLAQTLSQPYPLEPARPNTPDGVRPGRIRNYAFLEAVYGATQEEVRKQIVHVNFCGKKLPFSKSAGAAEALQRVATQLEKVLNEKPELRKYCVSDGAFYWRKIAGTEHLSPHSYGIAIDLCTKYATYWRWEKDPHAPHPQQKRYPPEIVKAFEDNGFIWGGKWHEYDIMHFEYRPELILLSKKTKK